VSPDSAVRSAPPGCASRPRCSSALIMTSIVVPLARNPAKHESERRRTREKPAALRQRDMVALAGAVIAAARRAAPSRYRVKWLCVHVPLNAELALAWREASTNRTSSMTCCGRCQP